MLTSVEVRPNRTPVPLIPYFNVPAALIRDHAVAFVNQVQKEWQNKQSPSQLILDFRHTRMIDSSGIGALQALQQWAQSTHTTLVEVSNGVQLQQGI